MAEIIDGKKISQEIKDEVKSKVEALKEDGIEVTLAVILVGNDPASGVYVNNKKKACEYTGMKSLSYELPADTKEEELLNPIPASAWHSLPSPMTGLPCMKKKSARPSPGAWIVTP